MAVEQRRSSILKRILRALAWLIALPIILLALALALLYLPVTQDLLRGKAERALAKKIGTPVRLRHLALRFPIGLTLEGLSVQDQQGDTLLYAERIRTGLSLRALLDHRIDVDAVRLQGVRAVLRRSADHTFNFDYILRAFKGADTIASAAPADTAGRWSFALHELELEDIRFDLDMQDAQLGMSVRAGSLTMQVEAIDPAAKRYHVDALAIKDTRVRMHVASKPPEPDAYPDLKSPLAAMDVALNELDLEHSAFTLVNTTNGDSLSLDVSKGALRMDGMDLAHQLVHLRTLKLSAVHFAMLAAKRAPKTDSLHTPPPWLDQNDGFRYWLRDWDLSAQEIAIDSSDVQLHTDTILSPHRLFDPRHIAFTDIALHVHDLQANNTEVHAGIDELAVTGGARATSVRFTGRLDAIPTLIAMSDATLTADSNSVTFSALASPDGLSAAYRFPERVPLQVRMSTHANLARVKPLFADLGIAWPERLRAEESWNTQVAIAGTIEQMDTLRLDIDGDQGTVMHLDGNARNIRDGMRASFNAQLHEITMGRGLHDILTAFVPGKVPLPERFTGSIMASSVHGAMKAKLDLHSDLADISGNVSASGLSSRIPDDLHVDLDINDADLHRLMGDTVIGLVSMHVLATGERLNSDQRSGHVEVTPSQLHFRGQDLSSLRISGEVLGDSIHADITSDAPALAIALNADARWPARSDSISGAMTLRVRRLALHGLGLVDHGINAQGIWRGTARASADGLGDIALTGDSIQLSDSSRTFNFKEFALRARAAADSTILVLSSDAVGVDYRTNVRLDSVLPHMSAKLSSFFRADSSYTPFPGEHMALRVELPRTEWLTDLVLPELKAIELEQFIASYDSDADKVQADIDVPLFAYGQAKLTALSVKVDGTKHDLNGTIRIEDAGYDSLHVHGLTLTAIPMANGVKLLLREQEEKEPLKYQVPIELTRGTNEMALHIGEGLILDTLKWTADPDNQLRFTNDGPMAEHFTLNAGEQRITLVTGANSTRFQLEKFDPGTLLNFISRHDTVAFLAGAITGEVELPLHGAAGLAADLRMENVVITGERLGDIGLKAHETRKGLFEASMHLKNGTNTVDGNATIGTADPSPEVNAQVTLNLTDLGMVRPFTDRFLYSVGGALQGTAGLVMHDGQKHVQADLTFKDAAVGVRSTGTRYTLMNEHLLADNTGLHLQDFTLRDSLGNAFVLDGDVFTTDLSTMRFDLRLRTDSFQLAHSTRHGKQMLYGDLFTGLDVRVTGTDRTPVVKGDLRILPGTVLNAVLPGSEVKLVKSDGIVEFTADLRATDSTAHRSDEELLRDSLRARLPRIDLDLAIHVDSAAVFAIVLDPVTGDQAEVQGEGDLRFRYTPEREMLLTGPFTLTSGGYTLEFYGLVRKRFDLVRGGQVLWSGDPVGARMDVQARYLSESASYPLVANATGALSEVERNRLQSPLPFEVIINIDGAMKKPEISFGLDLDAQYRHSYPKVDEQLDRLAGQAQADERNRQVFGLLVLNSFIQDESANGPPSSNIATGAARSSVNGILTEQMNKLTGNFVKGVDIQLGVNTMDQTAGNNVYQRTSVDYKVRKSFLNKRLSFELGGSVGVDEDRNLSNVSSTRAAQYAILYDLTPSGRFRLRGFYENAFDLYDGEITDSGLALMYTRDFEENEAARERAREAVRAKQAEERRHAKEAEQRARGKDKGPTLPKPDKP